MGDCRNSLPIKFLACVAAGPRTPLYVEFVCELVHKSSFKYPSESQGQNSQEGVGKDLLQFTAHNERAVRTLKPFSEPKNALREVLSRPKFACKSADWFSSVFQSLQMHCSVFCNLADSSSVKTNQEIMIFSAKNKLHTFRSRSGI